MSDKKEEGCCSENEGSCGGGGCGSRRCCSGKALGLIALLLVVGLIGYMMGKCCSQKSKGVCPMSSAPIATPAAPVK